MSIKIEQYEQYGNELKDFIHKVGNDKILNMQDKTRFMTRLYDAYLHCINRIYTLNGSNKKNKNK